MRVRINASPPIVKLIVCSCYGITRWRNEGNIILRANTHQNQSSGCGRHKIVCAQELKALPSYALYEQREAAAQREYAEQQQAFESED